MAERIAGIALMPRQSRNGIYYDVDELKKFDGVTVPLRVEHDKNTNIGSVTFSYDEDKQQVKYEAIVTDVKWQQILENEQFQVSIGASVLEQRELCDSMRIKCLNAPVLKEIKELSIVRTPGIPESSLIVIESKDVLTIVEVDGTDLSFNGFIDPQRLLAEIASSMQGKNPDLAPEEVTTKAQALLSDLSKAFSVILQPPTPIPNTSIIQTPQNQSNMTEPKPITNEESLKQVTEKVKVTIETDGELDVKSTETKSASVPEKEATKEVAHPCPPGQKKDKDGKCVEEKVTETKSEIVESKKEIVEAIRDLKEAWKPTSEVSESSTEKTAEEDYTDEQAKKFLEHVFEYGYGKMVIDKEGFIETHTYQAGLTGTGSVQEAITTSGTIPGVKLTTDISIQLGAKSSFSIRQFGKFEAIATSQNTARFYRITVPDAGAITESPTTDITAVTHTLTSIDVTCAIRGWRQTVEKAELEDFPAKFLNAVRETARIEAIRDEHRLIVQDLAATDHDFGGTTTAPFHIGGSDGVATTDTTEEDADGEFDEDGITVSKRLLGEQGQKTTPGMLVAFLSERAFESLYTSTTLSEYAQIGNPNVTRLGQLERLYGVDIIVTNELLVANNAYRNLVVVKGAAWGLCSQRNMEIELQKQIAGQYWDIVWTHRIGVDILDPNTYIIVSSIES